MTDLGLGSWPARRARISPDRVALRQADRVVTYRHLAARVDALAAGLAGLGVGRGDRVAYLGPNDIATFELFFATARIGGIFVPVNARLAAPEVAYVLADCVPSVLVHAEPAAGVVAAARPASCGVRTVVTLDPSGAVPFADLAGTDAVPFADLAGTDAAPPPVEVGLDDDAVIMYTSGTTGRPKGAVLTHANLTVNTLNQLAHIDMLSTDVALCLAPLYHVTGLAQVSLPTLFKGGTVVVAPRFDAGWTLRTVAEHRITAFCGVPTMLQMLCEHPDWPDADVSSLRYVIAGGSPMPAHVALAWRKRGITVLHGYGMTEAAAGVLMTPVDAPERPEPSPGVAHFFTDTDLLDPAGEPPTGELLVRGPHVFRGYWRRAEETAGAFHDGWLRTGDVVRAGADGWYTVVDRVKNMIISGGENIYPAEVEAVLLALPEVEAAAVIGVPDRRWGEVGYAFLVPSPGAVVDEARVRRHLELHLARYKIPRYLRVVTRMPVTSTGKIRRAELRKLISEPETEEPA